MPNKHVVLILLLSSIIVSPSIAMDVQTYEKLKTKPEQKNRYSLFNVYIKGLGEGYSFMNVMLKEKADPVFCPPQDLALNVDNYMAIIDAQIAKRDYPPEIPVQIILYDGLVDTFDCSK